MKVSSTYGTKDQKISFVDKLTNNATGTTRKIKEDSITVTKVKADGARETKNSHNLTVNDGNVSIVELSGTELLSGELDPLGEKEYYEIEYIVEETGVNPDASTTTKITGSNKAKVTTKDYPYGKEDKSTPSVEWVGDKLVPGINKEGKYDGESKINWTITVNGDHMASLIGNKVVDELLKNGKVKLMDFGAARDYTDFGEKSLSIVLKPGYAPEEQYRSRGIQGPWTDIYALSATIYKCITGITPEESMQRVIEDSLEKPSKYCKDIPKGMENAIMKGMSALQKNRYQNLKEFCEALYSDFEDAGEEKKKPVSISDGTLKSVNEEKEKAKSGQNALGTGMEKLQNLTKQQKMIAGAAVILVVLLIFAGTSLSGGKKQNSSTSNLPTDREMVSDVLKNSQWEGTILNLRIIDDDNNRQYEVYTADCEIESKRQGGSGTTSKAKITYKLQDDEWVFVKCEKQN